MYKSKFMYSINMPSLLFCFREQPNDDIPDVSNDSIFDDLLNKEPVLTGDFEVKSVNEYKEYKFCEILENDLLIRCDSTIIGICFSEDILVLLCRGFKGKEDACVLVYSSNQKESQYLSDNYKQKFQLPIQLTAVSKESSMAFPKISVVVVENSDLHCSSSSIMPVPLHLFSLVFGWAASVRNLPVLLLSYPGGSVYFRPLDLSPLKSMSSWRLLCNLETPLVDILCVKVARRLNEAESVAAVLRKALGGQNETSSNFTIDAMLVVGGSGKCCVIAAAPSQASLQTDFSKATMMFSLPDTVKGDFFFFIKTALATMIVHLSTFQN